MIKNIILLVLIFLSSCITQKKCFERYPSQVSRDSIYIETITEVPLIIEGDTMEVVVPVNDCPDQDLFSIENSKLKQQISILKGKLTSSTTIKPDTVIVNTTETKTVIKEIKVPDPVPYVPKFIKLLAGLGAGFIVFILAWLFLKYGKKLI